MHFLFYATYDSTHHRYPVNGRRKSIQLIATLLAFNALGISTAIIGPPPFEFDTEWVGGFAIALFVVVHLFCYLYLFRSGRINRISERMGPKFEGRKWILKLTYYLWFFFSIISIPLGFFLGAYFHEGLVPGFMA